MQPRKIFTAAGTILVILGALYAVNRVSAWRGMALAYKAQNSQVAKDMAAAIKRWDGDRAVILSSLSEFIEKSNIEFRDLRKKIDAIEFSTPEEIAKVVADKSIECEQRLEVVYGQFTLCADKSAKQEAALQLCQKSESAWVQKEIVWTEADREHKALYEKALSDYNELNGQYIGLLEKKKSRLVLYAGVGYSAILQNTVLQGSQSMQVKIYPSLQFGLGIKIKEF